MKWLDGKTAPTNGAQFLAAWKVPKGQPGEIIETSRPGAILDVRMIPGDVRVLRRVWWDGHSVYSDPHYWMPLPDDSN